MTRTPTLTRIIVAIDPGLTGAIAWLSVADDKIDLLAVHDIPTATTTQNRKKKSQLLMAATVPLIRTPFCVAAVIIEEVSAMPGQGVTSMFRFGYTAGALAGLASGLGLPVHFIRPQEWQRAVRQPKGDKDAGRLRANQIFPNHAHLFARKMDHNRADAALIGLGWALLNTPTK